MRINIATIAGMSTVIKKNQALAHVAANVTRLMQSKGYGVRELESLQRCLPECEIFLECLCEDA